MRDVLLRCLALLGLVATASAVSPPIVVGPSLPLTQVYVVRPDPRACPSPTCGGYWVALTNHARTRCADGLLRPRCYAAAAMTASGGPWRRPLPSGALVQGRLRTRSFGQLGELGVLVASYDWSPADARPPTGRFFLVRDAGIRCVRAPCFSYRAMRLNSRAPAVRLSRVGLGVAGSDAHAQRLADVALRSPAGLLAAGGFQVTHDGGRAFVASQLYLRR